MLRSGSYVPFQNEIAGAGYKTKLAKKYLVWDGASTHGGRSMIRCNKLCPIQKNGAPRGHGFVHAIHTKLSLFQPTCRIENRIPRSFSATADQNRPLSTCHDTTQQALSAHLCSVVSSPSIPDLDEKSKNRLFSPMHGEARLNSCVCGVHEGKYSTDNNGAP